MACIKEYRRGAAIIRIFDDDVVKDPEEQRRLQNTLLQIGNQIRRDFARLPREERSAACSRAGNWSAEWRKHRWWKCLSVLPGRFDAAAPERRTSL